jgi:hypothetical protein
LKPDVPIVGRTEAQLGDSIELIFVNAIVTDARGLRPETAVVMRDMKLPILKLSRQPRAHGAMHVSPIVVEEIERDSPPLPEKYVENHTSCRIPRGNIIVSHKVNVECTNLALK